MKPVSHTIVVVSPDNNQIIQFHLEHFDPAVLNVN